MQCLQPLAPCSNHLWIRKTSFRMKGSRKIAKGAVELDRDGSSAGFVTALEVVKVFAVVAGEQVGKENLDQRGKDMFKVGSLGGIVIPAGLDQCSELGTADVLFEVFRGLDLVLHDGVVKFLDHVCLIVAFGSLSSIAILASAEGLFEGPLERAHFVEDDSEGVDIDGRGVSLAGHDFGCHVSGGSADFIRVAVFDLLGHAKVEQLDGASGEVVFVLLSVAAIFKTNVVRFEISQDNVLGVEVFHSSGNPEDGLVDAIVQFLALLQILIRRGGRPSETLRDGMSSLLHDIGIAFFLHHKCIQPIAKGFIEDVHDQEISTISRNKRFGEAFVAHASKLDDVFVGESGEHLGFVGQFGCGSCQVLMASHSSWVNGFSGELFRHVGIVSDHVDLAVGSGSHVAELSEFIAVVGADRARSR